MRKIKESAAFKRYEKETKKPDIESEILMKYFKHVPYGLDYGMVGKKRVTFRALLYVTADMVRRRKDNLKRI